MELAREAEFYGLREVMFPPFVPADPEEVTTDGNKVLIVTQDNAGLWYVDSKDKEDGEGSNRCLVRVCDGCARGQPCCLLTCSSEFSMLDRHDVHEIVWGIDHFADGRVITPAQPRKAGCNRGVMDTRMKR
jgi:hypothetical protein